MNKFKSFLQSVLFPTCTLTVLIETVFLLILYFSTTREFNQLTLGATGLSAIFLFSLAAVLSGRIFKLPLHLALRFGIHYVTTIAAFFLIFILYGGYYADRSLTIMIAIGVITLIYAIIALPILVIYLIKRRKKNETDTYRSMLTKNKI